MGFGTDRRSSWDMLSDVDSTTPSGKFINAINGFMRHYRDKLGLNGDSYPYWFVSNDLVGKYLGFIKLCQEKEVDIKSVLENITYLFIDTYDEDHTSCGCCHLYHSIPKDRFMAMCTKPI